MHENRINFFDFSGDILKICSVFSNILILKEETVTNFED